MTVETIVLTASAGTFAGLGATLDRGRVRVEEHPLIGFGPPHSWTPLDSALIELASFGSIAFTSPRAAQAVVQRSRDIGTSWPRGSNPAIWAIGPATKAALDGFVTEVRGPETSGDGIPASAAALGQAMVASGAASPVLFPCGENRREELPAILREHGFEVREVVCYRSVLASPSQAGEALARGTMVVVASPRVMQLLAGASDPAERPRLIAVGPTTAASARALGWIPAAVAREPSREGLAAAIRCVLTQS
jgi:uroporphyrinogen-III synthase